MRVPDGCVVWIVVLWVEIADVGWKCRGSCLLLSFLNVVSVVLVWFLPALSYHDGWIGRVGRRHHPNWLLVLCFPLSIVLVGLSIVSINR